MTDPALHGGLLDVLRDQWCPEARIGGLCRAEGGFSNETWFLDVVTPNGSEAVVLRRQALVGPLEPYDLGREARIIRALADSDVPVPEIWVFCPDPDVIGSAFMVMSRIEGVVPEYRNLPEYSPWADPRNRTAMASELVRMLGAIQRTNVPRGPLAELLAPIVADDTPPIVSRVRWILEKLEYQVGSGAVLPVLREAASWLCANAPAPEGEFVLVHGDYKVGNFIWLGNSIVAVLDWEGAGLGDALEDLGYACHPLMRLRAPELMAMLVPFDELQEIYEFETGQPLDRRRLHYYVIYAVYFHLYTLVSGLVAATNGADLRVALGYPKFHRATTELLRHIQAFERGLHVL